MAPIDAPKLTHAFDLTIAGPAGIEAKATEHSARSVGVVARGSLVSADGTIKLDVKTGADWMTLHSNYAHIDARVSCLSPAGQEPAINCEIEYKGIYSLEGAMLDVWAGKRASIDWGESYYYTAPLMESRNEELAWVNKAVFLSMGKIRVRDDGYIEVVYRIFKVG
ncbi:uncharacterized protein PV07_09983 [Cladophialophora immunda]|uniref:Uncharacterized protein n=1 Tax=Cladophialophora immunda TaxID=569365 RepID=A0A0D2C184_9EURO|nr:uncharacterized protein PV07_09983 [Cladophialophora immunda]KIW24255.1 hypothetical protein PV07_09983 [Cladophialophora immunda]OQV09587.1 hypothetical protein CLAIMM_13694 [Cladophialophora immunda]